MEEMKGISCAKIILVGMLGTLIICILILSWVPPVSKDALIHHLAIPKLYLRHGGIYEIPSIPFSYYPMNLNLLYLIPLYFGNDIVPKLIHFSFALLTSWLIFRYLKHRLNTAYALFGVVFFLSIPIIVKLSITAYVDLGLIFFCTASLLLILKWIETGFRLRFLVLSAVLCGLAMGTKYNGLIAFVLLTLSIPFIYSRYSGDKKPRLAKSLGYGILFLLVALLVFSPWMVRNYHWKGNPIYPLYGEWFNPPVATGTLMKVDGNKEEDDLGLFGYRAALYGETWWQIVLLPLRVFFEGKDESGQYFDGRLNPFLIILPIFAFFPRKEEQQGLRHEKNIMLAFVVLFFSFAFFSTALRIRYISPIIPPLVILSVFGVKAIVAVVRGFWAPATRYLGLAAVVLILGLSLGLNAGYISDQFKYVAPLSYTKGAMTRDDYISKYRPEYPAMRYVNKNLPVDARCLFIFLGKRGYFCDRDYIPDTRIEVDKLYALIKNSNDPGEFWAGLKERGVTHLIIRIDLFEQWVNNLFSADKQKLLKDFFQNRLNLLYEENGIGVFQLTGV